MKNNLLAGFLGFMILGVASAPARFAFPQIEKVPVERLVANLEKQIATKPEDVGLHSSLARLHSMAYAMILETHDALKTNQQPYFGPINKDRPPTQVKKVGVGASEAPWQEHLKRAIASYEKALALDTNHFASRLGLAWCQDQSGDKTIALVNYRLALVKAWAREGSGGGSRLDTPLTPEIVGYMLPLLDAQKDGEEIERIKGYAAKVSKNPRAMTPILMPLEAGTDLDELVEPRPSVQFDLDGSTLPRKWGWITPKAAWLVYDGADNRQITSGLQLFGGVTFWVFWKDGTRRWHRWTTTATVGYRVMN